ncbi:MAG: sigma 54-interacting transcriptional regulator [Clostridiales Family XIII bacterium]|jgi:PAS domain S-box-containing protein|nr:sigma 54-interacting transcriptional regulator [Clostridiales Family XIII bacterium]
MRAQGQISLSESDLYGVLDKVDDAIFIDDANGNALWLNRACEDLYKISRDEVIGTNIAQLEREGVFTPSVARLVIESGKQADVVHQNRDGKRILSTGTPIFDEEGRLSLIISTSRDITELINLQNELEFVQNTLSGLQDEGRFVADDFVAQSPEMREVLRLTGRLAEIDSTVLISGESGVGKGVIAELLHRNGPRKNGPFVKINCGAIPENLIESELFGYEGGAFTGSGRQGKAGLFETADKGSVFLDEISELPVKLQVKLLQAIQDRAISRVGGVEPIPIDVRIISATNRNLFSLVREGQFREDLYYRLNVVPIHVPPLRERIADIAPLIAHFLNMYNIRMNDHKEMTPDALALLTEYDWPGNVRELQNIVERLMITTNEATIHPDNLPLFILNRIRDAAKTREDGPPASFAGNPSKLSAGGLKGALAETERSILLAARERYGSTRAVAKALGVAQPTVVRKMRKYDIP